MMEIKRFDKEQFKGTFEEQFIFDRIEHNKVDSDYLFIRIYLKDGRMIFNAMLDNGILLHYYPVPPKDYRPRHMDEEMITMPIFDYYGFKEEDILLIIKEQSLPANFQLHKSDKRTDVFKWESLPEVKEERILYEAQ